MRRCSNNGRYNNTGKCFIGENTGNTGTILEHDVVIESNCHLATGTICCGNSHIKMRHS